MERKEDRRREREGWREDERGRGGRGRKRAQQPPREEGKSKEEGEGWEKERGEVIRGKKKEENDTGIRTFYDLG